MAEHFQVILNRFDAVYAEQRLLCHLLVKVGGDVSFYFSLRSV